ncbi:MAG: helix-turn-helix domain-containing protein [Gammaproteobacteria bacterium]|nr:helix-turn-helix domain-containing protein [Gammaproteobacteria bacterium]MBU1978580.1 helix-turn-helix domain-containing protein [Gammaproteobacteria bacterium]
MTQMIGNLKHFDTAGQNIFIVLINNEKMLKTTPLQWLKKRRKWRNQEYRHSYMEAAIEQGVAWQIKINREKRNLSQGELANMIGSQQSAISRVEDTSYGRHRLETLTKIANAFDCALQVRFIPYSKLARDSDDLSPKALYAESYTEEIAQ